MNKYLFVFVALLLASACKEDAPNIDFTPTSTILGDTTFMAATLATAQPHVALIEDLTGVRCPNCPTSHDVAKTIQTSHPGRVVIMALHSYQVPTFTNPWTINFDFRDSGSDYIFTQLLGNPGQLPKGAVDRVLFSGEANRYTDDTKWDGYVNQQLSKTTPLNLEITNTYNAATREVTVVSKVECTSSVTDDAYLTLAVCENKIIAKQSTLTGADDNYEHNHILRRLITPRTGYKLNSPTVLLEPKRVIIKVFKYTLPAGWNENNCTVVGVVHRNSTLIDVFQSYEKSVK